MMRKRCKGRRRRSAQEQAWELSWSLERLDSTSAEMEAAVVERGQLA